MGAWIEILHCLKGKWKEKVAPYMGAWIEIHPRATNCGDYVVAPYMGAWIEMLRVLTALRCP